MMFDPKDLLGWIKDKLRSCIKDRQLIMRAGGETSFVNFSVKLQWACIVLMCGVLAVFGFLSHSFLNQQASLEVEKSRTRQVEDDYKRLLDHLDQYKSSVVSATNELRRTETELRRIFGQNESLRKTLLSKESDLQVTQKQRDQAQSSSLELSEQLQSLGRDLKRISGKNNSLEMHINSLRGVLAIAKVENEEIAAARSALDRRIWQLHNDLKSSKSRNIYLEGHLDNLKANLGQVKADLRQVLRERQTIRTENNILSAQVDRLNATLGRIEADHSEQFEAFYDQVQARTNLLEKIIRRTGIDMADLLPVPEGMLRGQGGPFIPVHPDFDTLDSEPEVPVLEKIRAAAGRWQQVENVFLSMPLVTPVKHYYVASRFGRRRDPFNGRWARHEGLDLAGPMKQHVFAAASGVVTFAGWRANYGGLVEIDHGNGLVTRYGHLYKVKVKKGEQVAVGDKVALLGNTGRSTGPHVHYEVRYKDKPLDPYKFLRATRDVQ